MVVAKYARKLPVLRIGAELMVIKFLADRY